MKKLLSIILLLCVCAHYGAWGQKVEILKNKPFGSSVIFPPQYTLVSPKLGYENVKMVDLGLSVLWADRNMGAESIYDLGGWYCWGDGTGERKAEVHPIYDREKDITHDISGTADDIAKMQWENNWRLPTKEEFQELLQKCKISTCVARFNGKTYRYLLKVTGPNKRSIFLPCCGYNNSGTGDTQVSDRAYYLTGSHDKVEKFSFNEFYGNTFYYFFADWFGDTRAHLKNYGEVRSGFTGMALSVRPVKSRNKTQSASARSSSTPQTAQTATKRSTASSTATRTSTTPRRNVTGVGSVSSQPKQTNRTSNATRSNTSRTNSSTTPQRTGNRQSSSKTNPNKKRRTSHIIWRHEHRRDPHPRRRVHHTTGKYHPKQEEPTPTPTPTVTYAKGYDKVKPVDLGLSVKWADRNIGADFLTDAGSSFLWSFAVENKIKASQLEWNNMHFPDDVAGTNLDIARTLWGKHWQMPTKEQLKELLEKCKWENTEYKGIRGVTLTGPNGGVLFLPYTSGIDLNKKNVGRYWSSKKYEDPKSGEQSYILNFTDYGDAFISYIHYNTSCFIRPVYVE